MPYDIRLVKLITGDLVLGKWSEDGATIEDPAVIQTVPSGQSVQMMLLPFGYPFDQEIKGSTLETKHVIYEYKNYPEDLKTKYIEACSNLTMATSCDLRNLQNMAGGEEGISKLIK